MTVLAWVLALGACSAPGPLGVYYWKTTLDWQADDTARIGAAGVDTVGLRLFDWDLRGIRGPLVVRAGLPASVQVVPVVYVTESRLEAWAQDARLDPQREAQTLLSAMDQALGRAWPGKPGAWQLDADWKASTRDSWFAVVSAFRSLVHSRGARLEVTVRLHQYRDRAAQGIPPADAGVLMLYGASDRVLDPALVEGYLRGPAYPLPLVPAYPGYTQVRQLNGHGRLVALHRLAAQDDLPQADLRSLGSGRWEVVRRASWGGRTLLAHDVLVVDRAEAQDLAAVAALPAVRSWAAASGGRAWLFDYDPPSPLWVPR